MSREKELVKNTLIITIGKISTQFIAFLLIPLYTALLSAAEYGTVDLVITIVQLLVPIVSLMIDQGVFRYLLMCKNDSEKKAVVSSAFFILLGVNVAFIVIYLVVLPFITLMYKIWILLILIATSFCGFFLQISRGLKKTTHYAVGSFVCSTITIVLNVCCIAFIKMGAVSMLIASFGGNLVCCLYLFITLRMYKYISISSVSKVIGINELKYSIPLVPNQLSLWVMNSSDRLIVSWFLGVASNGILAISHKFSAIYMTFFNIFQLAWHESGAIHYFDDDRDVFFSDMINKILILFISFCMGILVILPIIFEWIVNSSYSESYYNIPIYLVASIFNVVVGLLGVIYVANKKTFEIAKTTMLAAVINMIVNILLINYIGLYAASLSTFVGYLVTMIYRIVDTKKYLNIKFNRNKLSVSVIGLSISIIIYYIKNKVLSYLLIPVFIIFAIWLNRDCLDIIKEFVIKRKRT